MLAPVAVIENLSSTAAKNAARDKPFKSLINPIIVHDLQFLIRK
jgi:hypothetical protein